jgi:hypothetical protein
MANLKTKQTSVLAVLAAALLMVIGMALVGHAQEPTGCSIEVCKLDGNGDPIEGWAFQLWTAAPSSAHTEVLRLTPVPVLVAEGETGADGCVTLTDIPCGIYGLTEQLPQTVDGKTYTKVDAAVEISIHCTEPPTTIDIPAIEVLSGIWGVPLIIPEPCCDADPDASITFQNSCEVEVEICKLGIVCEGCDPTALAFPVPNWRFTVQRLPDAPVLGGTTRFLTGGCTDTIMLEPGDYLVCETWDPGFMFCSLEVNGQPVDAVPSGFNFHCYELTVGCDDVDLAVDPDINITYANAAGEWTRTPGYWKTHPDALKAAFECITGSQTGVIEACDGCLIDANDAMAIFWTAKGDGRPVLTGHLLAAMFNSCLLTTAPPGILLDARAVLCDPDATIDEISAVLEPLADFNESGSEQDAEGFDYGPADPAEAKAMSAAGTVPDCAMGKKLKGPKRAR